MKISALSPTTYGAGIQCSVFYNFVRVITVFENTILLASTSWSTSVTDGGVLRIGSDSAE